MGDPARFRRGKQFRSFTGLTPKAPETGETDRKGQPMSKADSSVCGHSARDVRPLMAEMRSCP